MIQITITNNQATLVEINKDWTNASGPYQLYLINGLSQETFKAENLTDQGNGYVFKFVVDFEGKIKNSGQYNLILCDSEGINIVNDIANIEVQRTEDPDDVEPDDFYYEADQEPIIIDGPQGIQGIQGNTGIQGAQGEAVQGEIGPQGVQGEIGEKGAQGAQGNDGAQGIQGYDGLQGVQGETGIQGPQGLNGESFPAWFGTKEEYDAIPEKDPLITYYVQDAGIHWFGTQEEYDAIVDKDPDIIYFVQGEGGSGGEGSQGAQGEKGEAGEQGPKGDKGDKGNTGSQGVQGVQGIQGNDGARGPQGLNGLMEQADWNEQTSTNPSYIKNKPTIPTKTSDLLNDSGFINATTNRSLLGCNVYYFSVAPDENNRLILNYPGIQRAINALGADMTFGLYSQLTISMLNLKISFDNGSTFYRVEQHAQSLSNMDWSWFTEQTIYLRVNSVATTTTEGVLRIFGMDDTYLTGGYGSVYKLNPFRGSQTTGYKVIKSANTANGIEAIAFATDVDDFQVIYKPTAYKELSNGTFTAKIQPQRGRTVDANNTITRYVPFADEVYKTIYIHNPQDATTGNIIESVSFFSEFTQGDMFWMYFDRTYGPVNGIHISFNNGATFYDFARYGNNAGLGFEIPAWSRLLVKVIQVATATTNGTLRIIQYGLESTGDAGYSTMYSHANIPNSNTGDILKMVAATNTNNGRIGLGVHPRYDAFEFIYKPEEYKDQTSGRAVAMLRPERGQTIGSSDNISRDVAFVDEIPTKTSDLTNDSGFTTFSGNYNDLTNKPTIPQGTFETWTFTLEDNTTVTKSVFIGS